VFLLDCGFSDNGDGCSRTCCGCSKRCCGICNLLNERSLVGVVEDGDLGLIGGEVAGLDVRL
jgi:hypothetical protein